MFKIAEKELTELKKLNKSLEKLSTLLTTQLYEITDVLYEIRAWHRQTLKSDVKALLNTILDSPKKIGVYHLSDGTKTTRDIAKETGAGTGSVSRWWNNWIKRGIAIPISKGAGNRAKKLFDLKDFDIQIPDMTSLKEEQEDEIDG